jgi:allantoinase
MEGIYEYGSRAGVWRILREFEKRNLPLTVFGVATALQRHPELTAAFAEAGHEIACHGWKWIHYQKLSEEVEREHMAMAMKPLQPSLATTTASFTAQAGTPGATAPIPAAWWPTLAVFTYDSDYYGDDLPFWMTVQKSDGSVAPQLIVPYTLDCNDMRFSLPQGYSHADPFFQYMKDTFDALYAEGDPDTANGGDNAPKMMSIGMHCRLLGRPGRITALQRFLDHIGRHAHVWVARRIDIARHWTTTHPYKG